MKGYKKLMDIVAMVEKTVLVVTMILVLYRGAGCCHFRINYVAWRGAVCA